MRKFYIRWWYKSSWQKDCRERMFSEFGPEPAGTAIRLSWISRMQEYEHYTESKNIEEQPTPLEIKLFPTRPLTFAEFAVSRAIRESGLAVYPDGVLV